jgi:haloalkane dehalogenase
MVSSLGMGAGAGELFSRLRTPGTGEQLVLEENVFVEQVLPAGMNRTLAGAEHDAYREPFLTPRDRRPVLRWIEQIPVGGDPADVDEVIRRNQEVLPHGRRPGCCCTASPARWSARRK